MASKDDKGGFESWQGSLRDTPRVLKDMSSAVREAGSAALSLQKNVGHDYVITHTHETSTAAAA